MRIIPHSPLSRGFVVALLVIATFFVYQGVQHMRAAVLFAKQWHTQVEARSIATAINCYETEYSAPPKAKDNASLIRILVGDNRRGIPFLSPPTNDLNAKGELVDAWGKPFIISVDDSGRSTVISPTMMHEKVWQPFDSRKLAQPSRMDDRPAVQPLVPGGR